MSKFSSEQVLSLLEESMKEKLANYRHFASNDPSFDLYISSRVSLLDDLLSSLDFFRNYETED